MADGLVALADAELESLFHGDGGKEGDLELLDVIAWKSDLLVLGECDLSGDIGRSEEELGLVVCGEALGAASLLGAEDVSLAF